MKNDLPTLMLFQACLSSVEHIRYFEKCW